MLTILRGRKLDRVRAEIAAANRLHPETMKEIARMDWRDWADTVKLASPERVWRSRYFLAVLYREPDKIARRLSVCRTQLNDQGDYADNLSWDELMRVKFECGYGDVDAVELYPRDRDVVNVANLRHLWILPDLSDLAWRSSPETTERKDEAL